MERFCKDLRYHAMKIINYEEKEMILLTDKENKSYEKQKVCYKWKNENDNENEKKKKMKIIKNASKLYHKVRDHGHYAGKFKGVTHGICNFKIQNTKRNYASSS